jgi:hypothetical protein
MVTITKMSRLEAIRKLRKTMELRSEHVGQDVYVKAGSKVFVEKHVFTVELYGVSGKMVAYFDGRHTMSYRVAGVTPRQVLSYIRSCFPRRVS